jgi:hypothetical protein
VATTATDLWNAEVRVSGRFQSVSYEIGFGVDRLDPGGASAEFNGRAFVSISAPW